MTIIYTWIDQDGNELDQTDGYRVRDYFDYALDIEELENPLAFRTEKMVRNMLTAAYLGRDQDGVGLRWIVA